MSHLTSPSLRVSVVCFLLCVSGAPAHAQLFRQYEYEEEMYLSLDGTAVMYVNSSVPALVALRGIDLDTRPNAIVDREAVRRWFTSADTHVTRVSTSRRDGRRFVHVRLTVDDVRRLGGAAPFAWSTYAFDREGDLFDYRQHVGAAAGGNPGQPRWDGSELVAFRIHVPSRITFHNAGADNLRRGNILVWEQPLADRLRGEPLDLEAKMEPESILYRTLILFGLTGLAVAAMFAAIIWRLTRRPTAAQ